MRDIRLVIGPAAALALAACFAGCYDSSGGTDAGDGAAEDAAPRDDSAGADDAATTDDGDADDAAPDDAAPDDGGPVELGDCRSAADCDGRECVRVPDEPGGFRLCREEPPPEATGCIGSFDECCTSAECTERPGGGCYLGVFCGGAWRDQNVCRYDDCTTSAQCTASPHGVCVPRDVLGSARNECLYGGCRTAADCTAAPGGYCAPIDDPCCPRSAGFFCIYPGRCRLDGDCSGGMSCVPHPDGGTRCDFAACPA